MRNLPKFQKIVPDFIVHQVESTMQRARYAIEQTGDMIPMLTYFCPCPLIPHEIHVPIEYEHFVHVGNELASMKKPMLTSALGPEFSLLAMQMAERARDGRTKEQDQRDFIQVIGSTLYGIGPRATILSLPCRIVTGKTDPASIAELAAAGNDHPDAKDTIMIVGRNPIRTYAMFTPIKQDEHDNITYDKPYTIDSSRGDETRGLGLFADIYDPVRN